MTKYSLHEPLLGKQEKTYVENCLQTAWLSPSGKYVKIFESTLEKIAEWYQVYQKNPQFIRDITLQQIETYSKGD